MLVRYEKELIRIGRKEGSLEEKKGRNDIRNAFSTKGDLNRVSKNGQDESK
jgi:hypothetical protein